MKYSFSFLGLTLLLVFFTGAPTWPAEVQEPLKAGLELHDAGKVKEAIAEYDKVIKAYPKLAEAYFNRGNAYYDLKNYQQAIRDYGSIPKMVMPTSTAAMPTAG